MQNYLDVEIARLKQKISDNQSLLSDPEMGPLAKQEIADLENQIAILENSTKHPDTPTENPQNPYANAPAILEIRSATGGDEAKLFGNDLLRMYLRFCENHNFQIEYLDDTVLKITKKKSTNWSYGPYETFSVEAGVHRVQRVPETESQGRIHTSTATVAVLPEIAPHAVEVKEADLVWTFSRAGGPGGQNVNKVNTAVRLTHTPTNTVISVRQERTQAQNRDIALSLLRSRLWEIEEEHREATMKEGRSSIGSGKRAEKIKTYNFPQNRLTDHRIDKSWYSLKTIIEGNLDEVFTTTILLLNSQ